VETGGKVFFTAADIEHGRELWVADLHQGSDDRNGDGVVGLEDLDLICAALTSGQTTREDVEGFWTRNETGPGDANFDHRFDSTDLIEVLALGKYTTETPASWRDGDWNCDGRFDSGDLVEAFQRGWYETDAEADTV
jgi:hypothetical protein